MRNWTRTLLMSALGLALLAGCAPRQEEAPAEEAPAPTVTEPAPTPEPAAPVSAAATLTGADGTRYGTVTFTQTGGRTAVVAHVTGAPSGLHGFHVHETGECTPPDFESAGDHFNPIGAIHGSPTDPDHHAGDLGNIQIGGDGSGHLEQDTDLLTVEPGPNSVVGRAIVLHADEDDFVSQPTGAAGGRLACGVVAGEADDTI
ncbi:MAG: superoxide dismutase family protein [Thermoanaerobaculia bacterium]